MRQIFYINLISRINATSRCEQLKSRWRKSSMKRRWHDLPLFRIQGQPQSTRSRCAHMRVESLNASAESSASSAKKIYASGEKENKCMHAEGEPEEGRKERKTERRRTARTESEQGREEGDMMMEDWREVGRPRKDEQTKCIRISLASVKTSDGASLEIFLVVAYRLRSMCHN